MPPTQEKTSFSATVGLLSEFSPPVLQFTLKSSEDPNGVLKFQPSTGHEKVLLEFSSLRIRVTWYGSRRLGVSVLGSSLPASMLHFTHLQTSHLNDNFGRDRVMISSN